MPHHSGGDYDLDRMMEAILTYFFWTCFVCLLVFAAVNDAKKYIIPNWVSVFLIGLFILQVFVTATMSQSEMVWLPILESIATAVVITAIFFVLFVLGHMGGGDVKLIGAISLWAGPTLVIPFLLLTAIAGGLLSFVWIIRRRIRQKQIASFKRRAAILGDVTTAPKPGIKPYLPYGIAIAVGGVSIALFEIALLTTA